MNIKARLVISLCIIITFLSAFLSADVSQAFTDNTPPTTITNLSVQSVGTSTATLTWKAPGDYKERTQSEYVIVISTDGLGSEYIKPLLTPGANQLITIKKIIDEGVGTLNARTDADYAITLPNHTSMITGRGVNGTTGHNWTTNTDPTNTLADNKGSYIASMFDMVHDNGSSTALWAGKSKFSLYPSSYSSTTGAEDITGVDNGRGKIDYNYIVQGVPAATLVADFIDQMTNNPYTLSFIHFQDIDSEGHSTGWSTDRNSAYASTSKSVDVAIGDILDTIENSSTLQGKTTVILTSDHGGHDMTHGDMSNYLDFTIPFLVWGAGVTSGTDLYDLNSLSRTEPATNTIPTYSDAQPIRNGDAGNLALDFLGLDPITDSTINNDQDLATQQLENATEYDIRYSTATITNGNWSSASQVNGEPSPLSLDTSQSFIVRNLSKDTRYYFGIRSTDDIPNTSGISNITNAMTSSTQPTHRSSSSGGKTEKLAVYPITNQYNPIDPKAREEFRAALTIQLIGLLQELLTKLRTELVMLQNT